MRDGIKGWARAFLPTVLDDQALLYPLMGSSNSDFAKCLISEHDARELKRYSFVDFRNETKFKKHHVKGARHVDYDDMWSKPMMEELNKRDNLIIIHDIPEVAGAIALTLKVIDYPRVYILK
ncbi:MAG: rhodanese-like domain-containing protein [Thermodesulfobacteriota bacterium]|nr:rhodanese-like domain-containing protein [Thermodesulfobacteriota bacterium]